jgi:hypothetical protein
MNSILKNINGQDGWITIAILVFSVIFLVVGLFRVVEFSGIGLGKNTRRVLIGLHVLGCFIFAAAMVFSALDFHGEYKTVKTAFFLGGIGLLFPIHIFLGLKRRIRLRDSQKP